MSDRQQPRDLTPLTAGQWKVVAGAGAQMHLLRQTGVSDRRLPRRWCAGPLAGGTLGVRCVALARMVAAWLRVGRTASYVDLQSLVGPLASDISMLCLRLAFFSGPQIGTGDTLSYT
jgi:hypothetical protein